jgi:MFS family permease
MMLRRWRRRLRDQIEEYPRPFWILVGVTFVDMLGASLLFPYFSLYATQRFGIGMTQVGIAIGLFSLSDMIGNVLGGALTDRMGRKKMVIFGLVTSAGVTLLLGWVPSFDMFIAAALLIGTFATIAGPARQAMVADLLPESRRAEGYGILRVSFNLAVTIGPAIGGMMAARSYMLLFISDAALSLVTAVIILLLLPETRPGLRMSGRPRESMGRTFAGYGTVLRDRVFVAFCVLCVLMSVVYIQMNTTLGVYLRDVHGIEPLRYGYILSMNAAMVVLFQFGVTRRIRRVPPYRAMAAGVALYAVGFALYGVVADYSLFLAAMAVITIGEMIVAPVSQALVAGLAPADMRGRYMAVFGFSWVIPGVVGPLLAGLVLDHLDPSWLWLGAGVVGMISAAGFAAMHRWMQGRAARELAPGRAAA